MENFNEYSKYYNLLYSDKNYVKEVDYVTDLIEKYQKNAKDILDIGCGTGKHANELTKRGYNVSGIDRSESMLHEARNSFSHIEFLLGDIRDFLIPKKYDIITSLFHVISYQNSNTDLYNAFECVYNHLNDGGYFIFDCWYGPGVKAHPPSVRVKNLENDEISVLRIANPYENTNLNIVKIDFDIYITNKTSSKVKNLKEVHNMRYFFQPEIEILCSLFNFTMIDCFRWMSFEKPNCNDWYVTFIIKK